MAKCGRRVASCAVTLALLLAAPTETTADLQAYGCDQGWTDFRDYCYNLVVADITADNARNRCESYGASVSSVWSAAERHFIISHWQFPNTEVGFIWLGLRGSSSNSWVYDDSSSVNIKVGDSVWSVFDGVSGMPAATPQKCVALRNSGTVAFMDCSMSANAYVCKKALPKVFITASLLNRTSPVAVSPVEHVQLFERMLPPELRVLPADNTRLAEVDVSSEVGCAFRCFSISGCQLFQVSCQTSHNCESYQCVLYSDFSR